MASCALLAALWVGGQAARCVLPESLPAPQPVCDAVERQDAPRPYLMCLADLPGCRARRGDAVSFSASGACRVQPYGMRPAWRLVLGEKMDLNRVTAHDLEKLDGVGPALAQAIVAERRKLGGFRQINDLQRVHGIGAQTTQKLAAYLTTLPP